MKYAPNLQATKNKDRMEVIKTENQQTVENINKMKNKKK